MRFIEELKKHTQDIKVEMRVKDETEVFAETTLYQFIKGNEDSLSMTDLEQLLEHTQTIGTDEYEDYVCAYGQEHMKLRMTKDKNSERELLICFTAHGHLEIIKAEATDEQIIELLKQPGEKIIIDRSSGDVLELWENGTINEETPDTIQSDKVMNFFKEGV